MVPSLAVSPDTFLVVKRLFAPADRAEVIAPLEEKVSTGVPFMHDATPQSMERIRYANAKDPDKNSGCISSRKFSVEP